MAWLWRFLFGYLTIKIYGDFGELLLNKAAKNGIKIWNLSYSKGVITGNILIDNFFKLRNIRHGTRCKIKIHKRHGLRFFTNKYKNRIGFFIGLLMFCGVLYALSNFIWVINVEGNEKLTTKEIISSCKKIGIYEGVPKTKINSKYDSQRLQLTQAGIAWCSFNIEGSVLTVNLSEIAVSDKEERKTPSNIKASFDGKIKKINIASGNVVVKVGDTVSKGDLLVSGVIQNHSSTLFVYSDGVITAETTRTFSAKGNYEQKILTETDNIIKRYTLNFFNLNLPLYLGNIKQQHNYNVNIKHLTLFDNKIPIKIACEKYEILQESTVIYDKETLKEILYSDINRQVSDFNFINIIEIKNEILETEKGMLLNVTYSCEENIALQDKILLNTQN